jgi:hypothetical protein
MVSFTCVVTGHARLKSVPVAARSKVWFCGRWLAGIAGSNPTGAWMGVACEYCVLSGSGGAGPLGAVAPWEKKCMVGT